MMLPIVDDIREQKEDFRRFILQLMLFGSLLFVVDRTLASFLLAGLQRYYGLDKPAEILLLGHSHTALGIDKLQLEKKTRYCVAKYARQGADTFNRLEMLRHYLSEHPNSLKVVVYDVDAHTFTGSGLSTNSYRLFFPFIDTQSVNSYVRGQSASFSEYWLRRCLKTSRFSEVTLALSIRGWLHKWTNLKYGTVNIARLQKKIAAGDIRRITFDAQNIQAFEETIKEIRARGIHLVLLYIPTLDVFNAVEPKKYAAAIRRFEAYAAADPGVTFLNYNPELAARHELFYDPIHMNPAGQKAVTERLAEDLNKILHGTGRGEGGVAESETAN